MRLLLVVTACASFAACPPAEPQEVEVVVGEGEGEEGEGEAPVVPVSFSVDGGDASAGVDFGVVATGASVEKDIVILPIAPRTSVEILSDPPVLLGGRDVDMWSVVLQPTATVPAAGSTVRVRFAPTLGGERLGALVLAYGVTSAERVILDVAGTGEGPAEPTHDPGMRLFVYDGSFDVLPNFDALTATSTSTVATLGIPADRQETDFFALRFQGAIEAAGAGAFSFFSNSDDGSRVIVDGAVVVNNDGLHGPVDVAGSVELTPGFHTFEVQFFEKGGGAVLDVQWQVPGGAREAIPASALFLQ